MEKIWAVLLYILLVGIIWLFFKLSSLRIGRRKIISLKWRILISLLLPLVLVLIFLFSLVIFIIVLGVIVLALLGYLFRRLMA